MAPRFDPEAFRRYEKLVMDRQGKGLVGAVEQVWGLLSGILNDAGNGIAPGALPPTPPTPLATYLVAGGQVTWVTGLEFAVAAGNGFVNGVPVAWTGQTVTLDAADPDDPRIDVIYVDAAGTADSITGVPSADPSEPVTDPATQLRLALVTVAAGATSPTVTSETVYAENAGAPAEWTWTTSGSGWNLASDGSPGSPRSGAVVIEGTDVDEGAYIQGERGGPAIDPAAFGQLVLFLGFKAIPDASRYLQVSLRNGGVLVGNALRLDDGFGLDETNTSTYQALVIPTVQFAVPAGTLFNQIRLEAIGAGGDGLSVLIDDILLTSGGITIIGGGGLSQDEADARYAQRANNLSDLSSALTARQNLQVTHANLPDVTADQHHAKSHVHSGDGSGTVAHSSLSGLTTGDPHTQYQLRSERGAANGYASLGADTLVPQDQLGTGVQDGTKFLRDDGTWQSIDASGRYRAWTYTNFSAGEFTYVVDGNGDPVYSLQALE